MSQYHYRAVDENNRMHEGDIEAPNRTGAITAIANRSWRPVSITEAGARKKGDIPLPKSKVMTW